MRENDGRFANISVISSFLHIFQKFKKPIKLEKLALSVDPPFGVKSGGKEPPRAYKKPIFLWVFHSDRKCLRTIACFVLKAAYIVVVRHSPVRASW